LPTPVLNAFGEARSDFEAGMAALLNYNPTWLAPLQREIGYLLVQPFIREPSNCAYVQLMAAIRPNLGQHSIMLGSLNYDILLEEACSIVEIPLTYRDTMPEIGNVSCNKPHGSSNFLPVDGGTQASPGVLMNASAVRINPTIRPRPRHMALQYYQNRALALPPAMSFFMPGKSSIVTEHILIAMQRGFADAVLAADKVIVVGVRPLPADSHIWGPIAQTAANVFLCCGEHEYSGWAAADRIGGPTHFLGDRFALALKPIIALLAT